MGGEGEGRRRETRIHWKSHRGLACFGHRWFHEHLAPSERTVGVGGHDRVRTKGLDTMCLYLGWGAHISVGIHHVQYFIQSFISPSTPTASTTTPSIYLSFFLKCLPPSHDIYSEAISSAYSNTYSTSSLVIVLCLKCPAQTQLNYLSACVAFANFCYIANAARSLLNHGIVFFL